MYQFHLFLFFLNLKLLSWLAFYIYIYIYIFFFLNKFIFVCIGSLLRRAGATLCWGMRASHCRGFSCCGTRAVGGWAQQLWCTGLGAPRHVGFFQTRDRTCVPCTGRRTPNHCATRQVPCIIFLLNNGGPVQRSALSFKN